MDLQTLIHSYWFWYAVISFLVAAWVSALGDIGTDSTREMNLSDQENKIVNEYLENKPVMFILIFIFWPLGFLAFLFSLFNKNP